MSEHPPVTEEMVAAITAEMLPKWAHIPDATIERDIADTEEEVRNYERLLEAERVIAVSHPNMSERRMADFRAGARPSQIAERQQFIAKLRRILHLRRESVHA